MKKFLLTAASAAVLTASSSYAQEGDFYVKLQGGFSKFDKLGSKKNPIKLKSKNSGFVGAGVGYHLMDNVRLDLTLDHFFNPEFKGTTLVEQQKINSKFKSNIDSLLLNGFVDFVDFDGLKLFGGAGIGTSRLSGKASQEVFDEDGQKIEEESGTEKLKAKYSLTLAGYLGGSYELTPGITAEVTYSYRHINKIKNLKSLGGHHAGVGIRFDI